jgi:hypothetical protein
VNHVKQSKQCPSNLEEHLCNWANKQTDEGFTALHFASYRGNLKMIEYFVALGCNISLKNRHGMNVLHISAQGDQVNSNLIISQSHSLTINLKYYHSQIKITKAVHPCIGQLSMAANKQSTTFSLGASLILINPIMKG